MDGRCRLRAAGGLQRADCHRAAPTDTDLLPSSLCLSPNPRHHPATPAAARASSVTASASRKRRTTPYSAGLVTSCVPRWPLCPLALPKAWYRPRWTRRCPTRWPKMLMNRRSMCVPQTSTGRCYRSPARSRRPRPCCPSVRPCTTRPTTS
ncbi:hypothetical protein BU14_0098s0018 [Porphyra umbilicalis]|uniref:Uncharacterized protein n=1 Tax=Porphyra umbilicalis TaxID=2786 RepID=A0A1X6PD51_PORUM|nr:hypothetical protein BU14_0098s0018 [Porphyra umbilicalis]|eukprot:OSX78792.1 hypothetical protein BU14_0098s0018 [Porphyra umbilicalis]